MYLLLANLYLCVFYAFYYFFLRRETFFQWNRIYLLSGLVLAFTLPLAEYKDLDNYYLVDYQQYLPVIQIGEPVEQGTTVDVSKPTSPSTVWLFLVYGYAAGCLMAFLLFVFRLVGTIRLLGKRAVGEAYSFFGVIRIDNISAAHEQISEHERVHAREWHSMDIMVVQVVKIVNWFNPMVYLYERAIKLQHEYIADVKTAAQDQVGYAELLVSRAIGMSGPVLANPFANKRILKSRVSMLLRDKSPRRTLLRYALLVPMVATMVILSIACNLRGESDRHIEMGNDMASGMDDSSSTVRMTGDDGQLGETAIAEDSQPSPSPSTEQPTPSADRARTAKSTAVPTRLDTMKTVPTPPQRQGDPTAEAEAVVFSKNGEASNGVLEDRRDRVFQSVEIPPEPPGGMRSFMEYVSQNYEYPEKALEAGVNGQVQISFVVEEDGSLSDIRLVRDLDYGTGEAAIRVLQSSGNWSPGIQNGRPVRVAYTLPIRLNLQS